MRHYILLILSIILGIALGISTYIAEDKEDKRVEVATSTTSTPPAPKEAAWAAKLRARASELKLDWEVSCYGGSYGGFAWYPATGTVCRAKYLEDGGCQSWLVKADTQAEAGGLLLRAIEYPPNFDMGHKPVDAHGAKKQCLPPVSGGPDQADHYQTECKDCGGDAQ